VQRFRDGGNLPLGYGVALSERCVELPFALSCLPTGGGKLLDAGSTLNHGEILGLPWVKDWNIHILSAGPERECHYQQGISYIYSDIRDIPTRDSYYDVVTCLSTLEHVGSDNSIYGGKKEDDRYAYVPAVQEMYRVLRPGGTFILTVPYGKYENFGWFQNYDCGMLLDALIPFRSTYAAGHIDVFELGDTGWQRVKESSASYRPHEQRAGAVACVCLVK
jgi:SAM-dependent methyltransferase